MTPGRWAEIDRVWRAVLDRPQPERAAAVLELSAGDETVRREVESLLAHLARASAAGFGRTPLQMPARRALVPGHTLGPYTVRALLGIGGMGEVYRAHDHSLGRDVALKILPEPWLADPDRRARLAREARMLASLNHPNIGAIYGVHESAPSGRPAEGSVRALVLELVEGETLDERIARHADPAGRRRGLPIGEVVTIARQLTAALDAAHGRDIVHRDLKPANITITPDLRVKVLDFGLAMAVNADDGEPGTAADPASGGSGTRMLRGTPAYMSPEQARGRTVDKRTDIWAFGCVLYEMLTGRQAFAGGDMAETLAQVVRAEPDWSELPEDTPSALRICLRRCLQKDPEQRIHDSADVRLAMEGAFEAPVSRDWRERASPLTPRAAYAGWLVAAIAVASVLVVVSSRDTPLGRSHTDPPTPPVLANPRVGGGGGSATTKTIQEAIDLVAPGGTVQMLPGTYTEALRIAKGVTLQAAGERTGPVIIAPSGTPESAIEIATTEPVTLRGLTVYVPGAHGIHGTGGVDLTVERSTILAVNPPAGTSHLITVSNDSDTTGLRARVVIRGSAMDGTITRAPRHEARPQSHAVSLAGDVDGVIERNIVRRTGGVCVWVTTRADLGGDMNVDIVNNDIDECHPVGRVSAILVGSPPIASLSPDLPVTATGTVNIVGNTIRNRSEDCLSSAIAYDVFGGRIERNRIVDFVQPCATMTSRNRPAAIWIGLRLTGIRVPPVVPSVRFNDIQGNARAGLRIASGSAIAIDATCNYWGSEQGPSGIGPGDGDAILLETGAVPPAFLPFARRPATQMPGC